ncbi:MAG TPA: hypothetical protein VN731_09815 [Rhodanobacter sp.]|nr:hypothetical protein [Rhodanobacter sp.]
MAKLLRNLSQMSSAGSGAATLGVVTDAGGIVVAAAGAGTAGVCGLCGGKPAQAVRKADRANGKARRSALFIR